MASDITKKNVTEPDGILLIDKPAGMTSHDVVNRIRRIAGTKKVGHTGTLDPDAEGVLPVCINRGTKVADMLTFSDKEYIAKVRLGIVTDTQDLSGEVLSESEVNVTIEKLLESELQKIWAEAEACLPDEAPLDILKYKNH